MFRILAVIALLALASCSSTPSEEDIAKARAEGLLPPSPLRLDLQNFASRFAINLEHAATEISATSASMEIRRNAVFWRMRMIPVCRQALERGIDEVALLDMWLVCTRMRTFFESKKGQEFFDDKTAIALEASKRLEEGIKGLAHSALKEEAEKVAGKRIEAFIKEHPEEMHLAMLNADPNAWDKTVSTVLNQPMAVVQAPFHALKSGIGVSDTVKAIHIVGSMVERMRKAVEYMPDNLRWQTDLLVLETEESQATKAALKSLEQFGDSSASLAATAETLPRELGQEVSRILTEFEAREAGLQKTMAEARATVEEVDKTLVRVEKIVATSSASAKDLTQTGEAWNGLVTTFNKTLAILVPPDDPNKPEVPVDPEESGPPFDINDYGRTAEKLTLTAQSLTQLFDDVNDLAEPERSAALAKMADETVRAVVDSLLLRAGLFLLFVVLLLVGYRLVVHRLVKKGAAA